MAETRTVRERAAEIGAKVNVELERVVIAAEAVAKLPGQDFLCDAAVGDAMRAAASAQDHVESLQRLRVMQPPSDPARDIAERHYSIARDRANRAACLAVQAWAKAQGARTT